MQPYLALRPVLLREIGYAAALNAASAWLKNLWIALAGILTTVRLKRRMG